MVLTDIQRDRKFQLQVDVTLHDRAAHNCQLWFQQPAESSRQDMYVMAGSRHSVSLRICNSNDTAEKRNREPCMSGNNRTSMNLNYTGVLEQLVESPCIVYNYHYY